MHLGLLKDYLTFLAGDLDIPGRSVGAFARFIFLGLLFDLINSSKLICPFLGSRAAALDEEYVSTHFLATSKGWFFSGFCICRSTVSEFLESLVNFVRSVNISIINRY